MYIIPLVPATVLVLVWLVLLSMATNEDWIDAAFVKVLDNRQEIEKLRRRDAARAQKLAQYHGIAAKVMKLFLGRNAEKGIRKLERENADLQNGILRSVNVFAVPGLVLQRKFDWIGKGTIHKNIMEKCIELYGKKYAANKARHLLACLLSYPVIGVSLTLSVGTLVLAAGQPLAGLGILLGGTLLVLVLVYAIYDDVGDQLNKRRATISRQFPNVVSKLALLVTSGMIMDRAWRETAESQELELYQEMRRTSNELSNLVEPATAYSNFIDRCNTKETTKLASAIIQNLSKGNAEIGNLLKNMAHEAWQERRHTAKRDSEAANSKLMIPTMLLFVAILIIIMVPVALNFSSM